MDIQYGGAQIKMSNSHVLKYKGVMVLPGEQDERGLTLSLDTEGPTVDIHFDEPIEGRTAWQAENPTLANRLKYNEVVFTTTGLPKAEIGVTWKFNSSLIDDSLAGVVIALPNDQRITGEKGFVLTKID